MNSLFVNIIKKYNSLKFNSKDEDSYFFENWSRHHLELFKKLSEENFENFDPINKEFMNKRLRMTSAFIQGLKLRNKNIEEIKIFKELLKEHDEIFKQLLNEVLNYYSEELIKAQRFRKVTAAYVNSIDV